MAEAAHLVKQIHRPCLPGRNKKSGTLCSFIENEKERPSSSCQRFRKRRDDKKGGNVTRTKRQSERKGREVKTCWCFGDQWKASRMEQTSAEKRKQGLPKRKECSQRRNVSGSQGRRSLFVKRECSRVIRPNNEIMRWQS